MILFPSSAHFQDAVTVSVTQNKEKQRIKKMKIVQSSYITR